MQCVTNTLLKGSMPNPATLVVIKIPEVCSGKTVLSYKNDTEMTQNSHTQTDKREEKKEAVTYWAGGGSTEEQQDQIRAFGLFILVNTTPRINVKF